MTYREIIEHLCSKLKSFGSEFWWKLPVEELLPSTYSQCGEQYVKGEVTRLNITTVLCVFPLVLTRSCF